MEISKVQFLLSYIYQYSYAKFSVYIFGAIFFVENSQFYMF